LKENGVLIYSTCTFASDENERVIGALVDSGEYECLRFEVPAQWSVDVYDSKDVFACKFLPHRTDGEGFFIGALRKKSASNKSRVKPKPIFKAVDASALTIIQPWCNALRNPLLGSDGDVYDSPLEVNMLNTLAAQVFVLQPGLHLGRVVRNDFIPDHGLAMSDRLVAAARAVELDNAGAMAYLRGDTIQLPQGAHSGWCLASHMGRALGWMKVIGARVNNYYPKEWRVRMR
jgi:NOL1/NOP2/fmu family ribosome biogenesis protein